VTSTSDAERKKREITSKTLCSLTDNLKGGRVGVSKRARTKRLVRGGGAGLETQGLLRGKKKEVPGEFFIGKQQAVADKAGSGGEVRGGRNPMGDSGVSLVLTSRGDGIRENVPSGVSCGPIQKKKKGMRVVLEKENGETSLVQHQNIKTSRRKKGKKGKAILKHGKGLGRRRRRCHESPGSCSRGGSKTPGRKNAKRSKAGRRQDAAVNAGIGMLKKVNLTPYDI